MIKSKIKVYVISFLVFIVWILIYSQWSYSYPKNFAEEKGIITFIFDDGNSSAYKKAFPLFRSLGCPACIALYPARWKSSNPGITAQQALQLQSSGWEVMSHGMTHENINDKMTDERTLQEIADSRDILKQNGLRINQFVAPYSELSEQGMFLLKKYYSAGYTQDELSTVDQAIISSETDAYRLHRVVLDIKNFEQLKKYVDYAEKNKVWLVFYGHEVSLPLLAKLLLYIKTKDVYVVTGTEALNIRGIK